jgi:hypothetical protein
MPPSRTCSVPRATASQVPPSSTTAEDIIRRSRQASLRRISLLPWFFQQRTESCRDWRDLTKNSATALSIERGRLCGSF